MGNVYTAWVLLTLASGMNYCTNCGNRVTLRVPAGDDRERYVCDHCSTIHYRNPRIITGCLPIYKNKVLLCKRAIQPRYGKWTLPAGFMENGETTEQGAVRETWEEARAKIDVHQLYLLFNVPQINQVYFFYRGALTNLDFGPGIESLEVELFDEQEIPWDNLAFPVMEKTLKYYFTDRRNNHFPIRSEDLHKPDLRTWKATS